MTNVDQDRIGGITSLGKALLSAANPAEGRAALEVSSGAGLGDIKYITSSGTWTKPAGLRAAHVLVLGAGGGGGYARPSASQAAVGGGGGAGEFRQGFFLAADLGATETVTIGALGAGGNGITPTAATAGGDTSFGTHITAKGGKAGGSSSSTTVLGGSAAGGAVSDAGSGGDIGVRGSAGDRGVVFSATVCFGGRGASGPFGVGGAPTASTNSGELSIGYGGGGAGGAATDASNRNGGDGSPGLVVVYEYF